MRKLFTMLAGTATIGFAAPAVAQSYDRYDPYARADAQVEARIGQVEARIDAGLRSGEIDRREAWQLQRGIQGIRVLESRYGRDGLSRDETADLERRLDALHGQVRIADRGTWDRYDRYARNDERYDRSDRYGSGRSRMNFDHRIERLEARLEAGIRSGEIDRREAWTLRRDLETAEQLERRYRSGGISDAEAADLRQRVALLRRGIRTADRGTWDRYEDRNEWAGWEDRNDDGYGVGGPYDEELEACQPSTGIGGLIGGILGLDECPGLDVGDRVTGNLYAIPPANRDQFRDGRNVYYRSDGRAIYGIDTRTHTVVRVYPLGR